MTSQIFEASNLTGLFISNTQLLFPPRTFNQVLETLEILVHMDTITSHRY